MRFTKIALAVSLNLVIGSIVVPPNHSVNHFTPATKPSHQIQLADGMPLPPLPPPNAAGTTLVADGMPLPPLPPPNASDVTLLADGMPLPPLPPPNLVGTAFSA